MSMKNLKRKVNEKLLTRSGDKINPYITRTDYQIKNGLVELISELISETSFLNPNCLLSERIYCVLKDIKSHPLCECGNEVKFNQFSRGYYTNCSCKCSANSKSKIEKIKETNLSRYGVEFIAQLPDERIKRSKSLTKLRPSFDYSNSSETRKKTIIQRYGNVNTGWLSSGRDTRIENGFNCKQSVDYKLYKRDVRWFTKRNDLTKLEYHELRDNHCRNENAYHLDHIVSIVNCYNNGISPEIAGSIVNLRFIPWKENLSKWSRSAMTIEELLDKYNERI